MKKGYKFGVQWIAENDDPGSSDSLEIAVVERYISTMLLADLFGKETFIVAKDIIEFRKKILDK